MPSDNIHLRSSEVSGQDADAQAVVSSSHPGDALGDLRNIRCHLRQVGITVSPPGSAYGPVTVGTYELIWIREGNASWQQPYGAVSWPVPSGTMILARPGMVQAYLWDRATFTQNAWIRFDLEGASGLLPPEEEWPTVVRLPSGDVARPLFSNLLWLDDHRPRGWESLRDEALRQLFLVVVTGTVSTGGEDAPLHPVIEAVLGFVNAQWVSGHLRPISLDELVVAGAVSRAHLQRLFRSAFGMSPIELLRLVRLRHAANLLTHSNLSIGGIAQTTGFLATFELSRAFSRVYGMSPRDYRRRSLNNEPLPAEPLSRVRGLTSKLYPQVIKLGPPRQ